MVITVYVCVCVCGPFTSLSACVLLLQISGAFEALSGHRQPIKGESAEYSLEVVKYDKGSKGDAESLHYIQGHHASCCATPLSWLLEFRGQDGLGSKRLCSVSVPGL